MQCLFIPLKSDLLFKKFPECVEWSETNVKWIFNFWIFLLTWKYNISHFRGEKRGGGEVCIGFFHIKEITPSPRGISFGSVLVNDMPSWRYASLTIPYWVALSVCQFAIETTFPLSNFKTKHIFGILMTLRKFLKLWGAAGAPNLYHITFTAAEGGGFQNSRQRSPNGGAEGAAPPESERNPAEGGCYASNKDNRKLTELNSEPFFFSGS